MSSVAFGSGSESAFRLYIEQQEHLRQLTPGSLNRPHYLKQAANNLRAHRMQAVQRVMAEGKIGDFYKLRVTSTLALLESLLFLAKANELANSSDEESRRAALQFGAAGLTTTAATLELGGLMQEWLATKSTSPAAREMAQIRLAGFKLAGNALAAVAGVVGAYYDFKDMGKARDEDKFALMWMFRLRGYTNIGAVGAGVAMGYSYSGPLLEHWGVSAGGNVALDGLAAGAKWLAKFRPWLFAGTWWLTFLAIAATVVIGLLDDDAMQKWCGKSNFRKPPEGDKKPPPLYAKPGEELTELYNAFQGTTS